MVGWMLMTGRNKAEAIEGSGDGGLWKTVQRVRRQRKGIVAIQGTQGGSRFNVLNDEQVDEVAGGGTKNGFGVGPKEDVHVTVTKEGPQGQLRKFERNGNKGYTLKNGVGSAVQSTSKKVQEGKRDNGAGSIKVLGLSKKGNSSLCTTEKVVVAKGQGGVVGKSLVKQSWKGLQPRGKENLHLGESEERVKDDGDLIMGGTRALEEEEEGPSEGVCSPAIV